MSCAILSDGSVVVRLAWHTIHFDVRTRAIHLRAPAGDALDGDIFESFPQVAVDRLRVLRIPEVSIGAQARHLIIELHSGRTLSLGHVPSLDLAMMTARFVSDLTRCKVEVSEGTASMVRRLPISFESSAPFEAAIAHFDFDAFDESTHPMVWGKEHAA